MQTFSYNISIYSLVLSLVIAVIITITLPKEKDDCAHPIAAINVENSENV